MARAVADSKEHKKAEMLRAGSVGTGRVLQKKFLGPEASVASARSGGVPGPLAAGLQLSRFCPLQNRWCFPTTSRVIVNDRCLVCILLTAYFLVFLKTYLPCCLHTSWPMATSGRPRSVHARTCPILRTSRSSSNHGLTC